MSQITIKHYYKHNDFEFVMGCIEQQFLPHHSLKANRVYLYGGYVRDIIIGKPFTDMDICVPSLEVATKFIQYLEQSRRIISLETKKYNDINLSSLDYQSFSLVIQTPMTANLKIDISYSWEFVLGEDSLNNCDFTMNNLMMDINGTVTTRIKAYHIGKEREFNEAEWTAKCIRDCVEGKLVWMIPDCIYGNNFKNAKNIFMEKMNMRLDKMLAKGFVLTGEHLTSFRLLKLRPVSTLPSDRNATMCIVCRENYSETANKPTAVSKCSHHFHFECIQKWVNKKREEGKAEYTCPCCRQEMEFYY